MINSFSFVRIASKLVVGDRSAKGAIERADAVGVRRCAGDRLLKLRQRICFTGRFPLFVFGPLDKEPICPRVHR
jgi:hypothetical protein